jgi:hypothetical protein
MAERTDQTSQTPRRPLELEAGTTTPKEPIVHTGEVVNIPAAVAYVTATAAEARASVTSAEALLASLIQGGVTGRSVELNNEVLEVQAQIITALDQLTDELGRHTVIGEAYAATPGAGTRTFNTPA